MQRVRQAVSLVPVIRQILKPLIEHINQAAHNRSYPSPGRKHRVDDAVFQYPVGDELDQAAILQFFFLITGSVMTPAPAMAARHQQRVPNTLTTSSLASSCRVTPRRSSSRAMRRLSLDLGMPMYGTPSHITVYRNLINSYTRATASK